MSNLLAKIPSKYKGIFFILLSAVGFGTMSVFVRLAGDVPSIQKSFFRNLVAFLVALVVMIRQKPEVKLDRKSVGILLLRSVFGTVGILCNFYAVDHLVLSDATMLNKMSPFFTLLFSFLILREKIKPLQAAAIAIAFIGSLFVVKPTFANADIGASLIGLIGGIGAGLAYTMVRKLGLRGVAGPFIVLFFSGFSCLVVVPYIIVNFAPMTFLQVVFLVLAGAFAALGQFSITTAYKYAPSREISIYEYAQVIFSAALGFFLFGQIPDGWSVLGYVIIIGIAVVMFLYNNRKAGSPASH